jgi:hypothetical protein
LSKKYENEKSVTVKTRNEAKLLLTISAIVIRLVSITNLHRPKEKKKLSL